MTLADLYPSHTKLIDIPPDFHGMPVKEWDRLKMKNQADAHLAAMNKQFPAPAKPEDDPLTDWTHKRGRQWRGRAIHGRRDDYGSKSL